MMERAEKISKPTASFSLNPKQMQKNRFAPRFFEPTGSEHEAPVSREAPHFSYNLLNIPVYPPVQRKEPEDEELQMKPSSSCPECEEEEIQAKSMGDGITPIMQRQADSSSLEDEEILQGKFLPVQRKEPEEEEELLQGKMAETVQRQPEEEEEEIQAKSLGDGITKTAQKQADPGAEGEEVLQGKFLHVQRKIPHFSYNLLNVPAYPPVQKQTESKPNRTGMPDQLKAGIESLSGIDMSDVRVHANSDKPAKLNALAYTQGNQIHLGPGQEKHLPHEAWHAVQQAQGRVKPIMQLKDGILVNDDKGLEHEADIIGEKAEHLNALAYAQWMDNPVVLGQEKPLPHEAGHVVQQTQIHVNEMDASSDFKSHHLRWDQELTCADAVETFEKRGVKKNTTFLLESLPEKIELDDTKDSESKDVDITKGAFLAEETNGRCNVYKAKGPLEIRFDRKGKITYMNHLEGTKNVGTQTVCSKDLVKKPITIIRPQKPQETNPQKSNLQIPIGLITEKYINDLINNNDAAGLAQITSVRPNLSDWQSEAWNLYTDWNAGIYPRKNS